MYLISQLISSHLHSCNLWPHAVFIRHGEDKVKSWKDTVYKSLLLLDYGKIIIITLSQREEFKLLVLRIFFNACFIIFVYLSHKCYKVYKLQSLK